MKLNTPFGHEAVRRVRFEDPIVRARAHKLRFCGGTALKSTAPWHSEAPAQTPEPPLSLDAIRAQIDELNRKVDRFDRVLPAVASPVQSGDGLATAISGLRGIVAHVASADALASLDRDVRVLADKVRDGSSMRGSANADAIDNLEQRIGSIADAIAAFRAESRERTVRNMASLIEILNEKIEILQSQEGNSPRSAEGARKPESLASIERGIADLIKEVKEVRANAAQCSTAPACNLERDLAELQQTHSVAAPRTRDALAAVHGTIDDLFARMASLESEIRDRATAQQAAPVVDPAPELAPAPTQTEPHERTLVFDSALIPDLKSEIGGVFLKTMLGVGLAAAIQPNRTDTAMGTLKWSCWSGGTAYVPRSSATFAGTRWTSIEPAGKAGALGQPFPGTPVDAGAAAAPTEIPQGRGESAGSPPNNEGSSQASDRAALPASAIRAPDAAAPKREPAAVNLHDVIRSCVTQCQPKANLAYLLIRTSLFPIPLSVRVDTEMLRELIVNLLDYAIKSTRSGGQIIVSCACPLDANGEPASIVLRVRGSGGCLRDQELSAALNASAKSASRPNSAASALALAKAGAEAIGASFAVTSGANDSTLVTIAFPRTAAANDPGPA